MAQDYPTGAGIFKGGEGQLPWRQTTSEKDKQAAGGKGKCGVEGKK